MRRLTTAMLLLSSTVIRAQSAPDFAPPMTYDSVPITMINPTMYWGAAGDFNGDGRMDLVAVDSFANNVVGYSNINGFTVTLASPTGGFSTPVSKSVGELLRAVQSADFNHDGFADLVVEGPNGAAVLLADGTGDFGAPTQLVLPIAPYIGAIADFNADGNPDLVFTGATGHAVSLGTATGAFQAATLYPQLTASYNVLTGDLNNDGKLDFAAMGGAFLGNGDGTFSAVPGGIGVNSQLGDFNRDGFPDSVSIWTQSVGQESAYFYVSIARGLGNGQFLQYFDWQFQGGVSGLLVDDFNRDGNPDVATYDFAARTLRVLGGNGTLVLGGFLDSIPLPSNGGMMSADMDGNGSLDIVYSNYRTYTVLRSTHGNPPLLSQLSLSPASVVGGSAVSATLSLGGAAPVGGIQVALSSSDPNAFFTAGPTVTIPAGASSATVQVTTTAVSAAASANLSASANGVTQTTLLDLVAPYTLTGFSISPASQYGIFTATGTVTLSGPASASAVVALSSGNPAVVTVPASITIPAGASSGTFAITLKPVTADTAVPVSVSLGGLTQSASVTVLKPLDSVAITKALFTVRSARLDVEATSTSATTTISVYNPVNGALLGTLANSGGGKYKGSFIAFPQGGTITLKSVLGGTVTGAYQSK